MLDIEPYNEISNQVSEIQTLYEDNFIYSKKDEIMKWHTNDL
jgi:hypothetical protein